MKKGHIYTGVIRDVEFPNKGIAVCENEDGTKEECIVKNTVKGQRVSFMVNKKKSSVFEGRLLEVIEKSKDEVEPACPHFGSCGGCTYLNLPYEKQLEMKKEQVYRILEPVYKSMETRSDIDKNMLCKLNNIFEGIKASPIQYEYRNKMEFSFGDACKGGELELGLHKRGGFYDILSVGGCRIVDEDYRIILTETLSYFRGKETPYYHKLNHVGYLRHLLVRKAVKTGEIMVALVTTSDEPSPTICTEVSLIDDWKEMLLSLKFKGKLTGILHVTNDSYADMVQSDRTDVLFGRDYIYEELLGLRFKITPFSFFQTNSLSAEVLYDTAREYIRSTEYFLDYSVKEQCDDKEGCKVYSKSNTGGRKTVFDLYSGTGTIAQLMADAADKVIGVEIVEEAVEAARENAALNGLTNCEFIAGDVLTKLDDIDKKPDLIILDPPRDGVNPKALKKIINYGVKYILYISCKPSSLARDLEMLIPCGYYPSRITAIDQFPNSGHVETVCLLSKLHEAKHHVNVKLDMDEMDITSAESKATYEEIKKYVAEHNDGMKVSNLYIAQVKRKYGLELAENFNFPKSEDSRQPQCPKEKEDAIVEALKVFQMV